MPGGAATVMAVLRATLESMSAELVGFGAAGAVVAAHLAHLERLRKRPGTIYQRRRALARLARFSGQRALLDLQLEDLRAFTERAELATETVAAETNHLVAFYRWALLEGLISQDPTVRLERPQRKKLLPRPMPDEDVEVALTRSEDPIRAWLHLAAYAGLRACEIAPLRGEDVRGDVIVIREQKGGDPGSVPLAPQLRSTFARLPRRGWLFPAGDDPSRPVSAGQVSRRTNRWLHEVGIDSTLHTLRHWYGTNLLRATGNLRVVQELMRHETIQSTVGYTALVGDQAASALEQLPEVGRLRVV